MNDLYANDIAREGTHSFWKVQTNSWSTIISAYPIVEDAITKVTI